jgi:hypothetical protein
MAHPSLRCFIVTRIVIEYIKIDAAAIETGASLALWAIKKRVAFPMIWANYPANIARVKNAVSIVIADAVGTNIRYLPYTLTATPITKKRIYHYGHQDKK